MGKGDNDKMSAAIPAMKTELTLIPNFPKWCVRTEVGMEIKAEKPPTLKEWMKTFTILDKTKRGHQWHIGDMLNEGEHLFGDDCYQVIDPLEEAQREEDTGETYRKYQQVACRFVRGRRRPKLSFGHHQTVAFLETEEEQDHWLDLCEAQTPILSVHKLRKLMKGEGEGTEPTDPDLLVLQDPEIRAWLEADIARNRADEPGIPTRAAFLRNMMHSRIGQSQWQLERTIEGDCLIVREAVKELLGTADEIFMWLQNRNYFMSPPDLDDRLDLLVGQGRIKEQEEEGRKEGQRGCMKTIYKPVRNPLDED